MKFIKKHNLIYYVFVILIIIFSLTPIIWCFILSISSESHIMNESYNLLPQVITFKNYQNVITQNTKENIAFITALKSSFKLSFFTLLLGVPISFISAYILALYEFKGKRLITNLLLLSIVIPVFATIIPIYSIFKNHNMLDNIFWTSIIYISSFIPLNTWIIMNFFKDIPKEIWEASRLDCIKNSQIFFKIALPLSNPVILTTILIMFLMSWKQYIIPSILLSSPENKVLTTMMSEFMTRYSINYSTISMLGIMILIPPIIASIFFRKYLISGLTSNSVKQ